VSKHHTVGYSQSPQVFKVFSFGLYTGSESFPQVDGVINNRLFKVSPHHHQSSAMVAMETADGSQQQ